MDDERFDRIAKSLAAGGSRRQVVRGLAAGLATVGAAALGWGHAGAQAVLDGLTGGGSDIQVTDPTCQGKRSIDNRICPESRCGGRAGCLCARDANGDKRCVNLRDVRCPGRNRCNDNFDCRRGEICIKTGGCCPGRRNTCVPRCG